MLVFTSHTRKVLFNSRPTFFIVSFRTFNPIQFSLNRRAHLVIVNMGLFTAVNIHSHGNTFVVPGMIHVRLQRTNPIVSTTYQLAFLFPFPMRTNTANRSTFRGCILVIVNMTLNFANDVFHFSRTILNVMTMNNRILSYTPNIFRIIDKSRLLMVSNSSVFTIMAGRGDTPNAIISSFSAPIGITNGI